MMKKQIILISVICTLALVACMDENTDLPNPITPETVPELSYYDVTFKWMAPKDGSPAVTYEADIEWGGTVKMMVTAYPWLSFEAPIDTPFRVRVRGVDASGRCGTWSEWSEWHTKDRLPNVERSF